MSDRKYFQILFWIAPFLIIFIANDMAAEDISTPPAGGTLSPLHVSGNKLIDASGTPVQLRGINRSGTEYMCIHNTGNVFDGPSDAASVRAMTNWKVNTVRIPLNEDCWLGINGINGASDYRQAIVKFVNLLNQNHMYAILDLHWNAPGSTLAAGQQVMADQDHAPAFWTSVASTFAGNNTVLFDLYNEPHSISWPCWKNGGACEGTTFPIAGMQTLVNAIRATGAKNVIMAGGLAWANDLSQWLANEPSDTLNPPQIAASWHVYNINTCSNATCWNQNIAPAAGQVPVIAGEIGENDCASGFITPLLNWMDRHQVHYLGWSWNAYDCSGFPSLISNYDGSPTNFGLGLKNHLQGFR